MAASPPNPGQPGFAALPLHAPTDVIGWLALADWYANHPQNPDDVRVRSLIRKIVSETDDVTAISYDLTLSESERKFSPAPGIECRGIIKLYSSQGSPHYNPATAATHALDLERRVGERSWEVNDSVHATREEGSMGTFVMDGPVEGIRGEYRLDLQLTELRDSGDNRDHLYQHLLTCTGPQALFLSELVPEGLSITKVGPLLYGLYSQPSDRPREDTGAHLKLGK